MIYKSFRYFLFYAFIGTMMASCLSTPSSYSKITPGIWRGVLELDKFMIPVRDKDTVILLNEKFKEGELPFNFEVVYTDDTHFYIDIINGAEKTRCNNITFGRDRTTARDTVNIYFPEYQSYIHANVRGGVMQGEWIVTTKENYRIPFYAHAGRGYRFTDMPEKPEKDLSGNWATLLGIDGKDTEKAIGEFKQEGNRLTGTFRTETGDYRFMEGTVQGRKFWMSVFDGSHAFLFSGSIKGDTLQGEFRSGTHYRALWMSWRDPNFELGHPDSLTTQQGTAPWTYKMTSSSGKIVQAPSAESAGKVGIYTLMGSWCPNCRDEQLFLRDYVKNNPDLAKNLHIVGFAFERNKTAESANRQLEQYRKQMDLPFELAYAGIANKDSAALVFPTLSKVMAFPTMIIVDKKGFVRKIHTGFDGPASSKHAAYKQSFESFVAQLLQE
jgi:thiol-disulfide isomerase/thioredoxin